MHEEGCLLFVLASRVARLAQLMVFSYRGRYSVNHSTHVNYRASFLISRLLIAYIVKSHLHTLVVMNADYLPFVYTPC